MMKPVFELLETRVLLSVSPYLPGDANQDNVVGLADLLALADNYGSSAGTWGRGDFTGDGSVGLADLLALADNYGRTRLGATVTLTNTTGAAKTDWPVFLTVWKAFGPNMDPDLLNPDGFHVFDAEGTPMRATIRRIPPAFSVGDDEIVFVVPAIAAGQSQTFRVINVSQPGGTEAIDLANDPHNLIANGGFESFSGSSPLDYTTVSNSGVAISGDPSVVHSGGRSLRMTFPVGKAATMETASPVRIVSGRPYHFSVWARTDNLAYTGWGFWGAGGSLRFSSPAFTGAESIPLRDSRDWFCYRLDPGGSDAWDVPLHTSTGAATRNVDFVFGAWQQDQPFLTGDKTGTIWLDDLLLFEQPVITVERRALLERSARNGAVVFARPVNMPRGRPHAHEAVDSIETFAMRGERRQVRFGVYAVSALSDVQVTVSDLTSPSGTIPADRLELEMLGNYISAYAPVGYLPAGNAAEYLLGIDVAGDTAPGTYTGTVTITSAGGTIRQLPLTLDVLPVSIPEMDRWVGGIYNIGYPLDRDDDFYVEYGKVRFNYMMLFDYFSTHMTGPAVDLAAAAAQVDKLVNLAHVTDGIGLYREPNISEDQPRKWYQIASGRADYEGKYVNGTSAAYKSGYQALVTQLDQYGKANGWPELLYMVSDEPDRAADVDPSMGWLNEALPDAMTPVDVQFDDMIATWDWYTLPVLDDPANWTGPLVYDYVLANKPRFGICGTAWGLASGRYQPGLMMATTGSVYWHFWHTQGPFAERNGTVERMHHVAAMGAGVNDLRYYLALTQAIDANQSGPSAAVAAEARGWLDGIFTFANGDHDTHLLPYNGVPWDWGDVAFYDRWRETMKDYLLALLGGEAAASNAEPAIAVAGRRPAVLAEEQDRQELSAASGAELDLAIPSIEGPTTAPPADHSPELIRVQTQMAVPEGAWLFPTVEISLESLDEADLVPPALPL